MMIQMMRTMTARIMMMIQMTRTTTAMIATTTPTMRTMIVAVEMIVAVDAAISCEGPFQKHKDPIILSHTTRFPYYRAYLCYPCSIMSVRTHWERQTVPPTDHAPDKPWAALF